MTFTLFSIGRKTTTALFFFLAFAFSYAERPDDASAKQPVRAANEQKSVDAKSKDSDDPTASFANKDINADEAYRILISGNASYVNGATDAANDVKRPPEEGDQFPVATIVYSPDMEKSPAELTNTTEHNVYLSKTEFSGVASDDLASIEYGLMNLQTPLLVVMGHYPSSNVEEIIKRYDVLKDGAQKEVDKVIDAKFKDVGRKTTDVAKEYNIVGPAIERVKKAYPEYEGDQFAQVVAETLTWQSVETILMKSTVARKLASAGRLLVVAAVVDDATGVISWLGEHPLQEEFLKEAPSKTALLASSKASTEDSDVKSSVSSKSAPSRTSSATSSRTSSRTSSTTSSRTPSKTTIVSSKTSSKTSTTTSPKTTTSSSVSKVSSPISRTTVNRCLKRNSQNSYTNHNVYQYYNSPSYQTPSYRVFDPSVWVYCPCSGTCVQSFTPWPYWNPWCCQVGAAGVGFLFGAATASLFNGYSSYSGGYVAWGGGFTPSCAWWGAGWFAGRSHWGDSIYNSLNIGARIPSLPDVGRDWWDPYDPGDPWGPHGPWDPKEDPWDPADEPWDSEDEPWDPGDEPWDPEDEPWDSEEDPEDPLDPEHDPWDPEYDSEDNPEDDPEEPGEEPEDPEDDPEEPGEEPEDSEEDPEEESEEPGDSEEEWDPSEPTDPVYPEPEDEGGDFDDPGYSGEDDGDWGGGEDVGGGDWGGGDDFGGDWGGGDDFGGGDWGGGDGDW